MKSVMKSAWEGLAGANGDVPFSLSYGGNPAEIEAVAGQSDAKSGEITREYRIVGSDVLIRAEIVKYDDFPAVEWVLHLTNTGDSDSEILEDINVLDVDIVREGDQEYMLNTLTGSVATPQDFTPQRQRLWLWDDYRIGCLDGRSSDGGHSLRTGGVMPTFDIEYDDATLICAVGWTGSWYSRFIRTNSKDLQFMAGWDHVHFKLLAGETVRTPRILLFHFDGPAEDARNAYRQFILKHHTPKIDGEIPTGMVSACSWFKHNCGSDCSEENQKEWIDQHLAAGIGLDTYWLDAGWYGQDKPWGQTVGDWWPTKEKWPNGLEPIGEYAKDKGLGFVLWFEPERVSPGTYPWAEHPEWLFLPDAEQTAEREGWIPKGKSEALLNLGVREACEWFVDIVSEFVTNCNVTCYRQDMNFRPDIFWAKADAPDRRGISEIRHIEGLYWMWDELLRRHPGLLIDNCASGGRRIDLETCSRSIPLWRNDCASNPAASQGHTQGLSRYFPLSGTGVNSKDTYRFRSCISPSAVVTMFDPDSDDFDPPVLAARFAEYRRIRPLMLGDFYELCERCSNEDVWCGYQFWREDMKQGVALFFRREHCPLSRGNFVLKGLKEDRKYELTWADAGIVLSGTGAELAAGVDVELAEKPGSEVIFYKMID